MVDNREIDINVKMITDKASATQSSATINKFKSDLDSAGKTTDLVSKKLADLSRNARVDALGTQYGKLARQIGDTDKATALLVKRLKEVGASSGEIDQATSAFARAQQTAQGGGAAGGRSNLTKFGSNLKALPSVQIPGLGGVGTDAIGKITMLLGALPPIALGLAGAIAVAGVALALVLDRANKLKEAAQAELNSRKEVIEFIQTATKEEIKAKIDEAKQKAEINKAVFNDAASQLEQNRRALESSSGTLAKNIADSFSFAGTAGPTLQALKDNFNAAQKEMDASTTSLDLLNQAYEANFAPSTEYIERLKEETKIKTDAALAGANDEYNKQLKLQQEGLMSSSQLMGKITDATQTQFAAQAALNKLQKDYVGGNKEIDTQILNYQLQIARTGADITRLYDSFGQRKEVEDAIQSEKDLAAARKEVDKINNDVNKATEKYNEDILAMADKFRESMENLKQSFDNAAAEAEIDRANKIADLATENNDKQIEAQYKYNDEKVKIEEDYQKRVRDIEKEFTRSSAQAIQDRDAVALDAAETKRKDELDEAKTNHNESLNEREKEYRAELRQLQQSNAQKIAEINRDFQRQAEQRARKYAFDQQQLYDASVKDRELRMSAYNKQLADLRTTLQQNNDLWAAAGQIIVNYAKSVKDSINNILGGGHSGVGNAINPDKSKPLISFASGGTITKSGLVNVHAGEVILNRKQQRGMGGGINVEVNGVGLNRNGVIREITRQLEAEFDAAGF